MFLLTLMTIWSRKKISLDKLYMRKDGGAGAYSSRMMKSLFRYVSAREVTRLTYLCMVTLLIIQNLIIPILNGISDEVERYREFIQEVKMNNNLNSF